MGAVKNTHPQSRKRQTFNKNYNRMVQSFDSRWGNGAFDETSRIIREKFIKEIECRILYGTGNRMPLGIMQEGET